MPNNSYRAGTDQHRLRTRVLIVAGWIGVAVIVPPTATAQGNLDSATAALAERLVNGDQSVRDRLAPLTRELRERTHQSGSATALYMLSARVHRAMAAPLSAPEAGSWTEREVLWRPGLIEALRGALASDSSAVNALEALHPLVPYPLLWDPAVKELTQFRNAARAGSLPPSLAATWVQLELEAGSGASAESALDRSRADLSAAVVGYLQAEMAFARGDGLRGLAHYEAGAAAIATNTEAALYAQQLRWIAQSDELTTYDSLRAPEHATWLRRYWAQLDAADARAPGSRLPEQFRRWRVSLAKYRWSSDGWAAGHPPFVESPDGAKLPPGLSRTLSSGLKYVVSTSPRSQVLDDRGSMVMRHGEPTNIDQPGILAADFATMEWQTEFGPVLIGFSRPELQGSIGRAVRLGMLVRGFPQGDLMTNCQRDAGLCVLGAQESIGRGGLFASAAIRGNQMFEAYRTARTQAESSAGNPIVMNHRIPIVAQAYGVEADRLLVVVSLPWREFVSRTVDKAAADIAVRVRMSFANQAGAGFSVDTIRRFQVSARQDAGAYASMLFEIPATIGTWTVGIVASDSGSTAGGGVRVSNVRVISLGANRLQISDLILGRPGGGLSWNYGGREVPLNPMGAWTRRDLITVNYRMGGLKPGGTYRVTMELWDEGTAETPILKLATSVMADRVVQAFESTIDISRVRPGSYRLVIRPASDGGQTAVSETKLLIK